MKAVRNKLTNLMLVMPLCGSVPQDQLVTINVRDEELSSLLEALSIQHRINLVAGDQVSGEVTINLFDVDLDQALTQILATQGLGYIQEGAFYRVVTIDELRIYNDSKNAVVAQVFPLSHLLEREAQELLEPFLSPRGQCTIPLSASGEGGSGGGGSGSGSGGASEGSSGRQRSVVVRDIPEVLEKIASTLAEIDVPPQQVLLEATILTINLGETNVFGIDFNVLGGIDFATTGTATDFSSLNPFEVGGDFLREGVGGGGTSGFVSDTISEGLALGFVKNQVAVFLEALEENTNASILSNPKVVALNGQEARIIVGGRLGYSTVVSTETTTLEEVSFLDTGTQLRFRPTIGDDGWIRMDVHPQNSTGVIDPVSGIPSETTAEVTTSVLMRDGQTLVIGGLISESIQTSISQVPLLGSIPVVGALFRRTTETLNRKELVVLLTPHVLNPVEEEHRAEQVTERWDAVRSSHLDNLSPYLRPKMASSLQADAEVLFGKGDLDGALGAVERSLRLNPTSVPASLLRQQLLRSLAIDELPMSEEQLCLEALTGLDGLPAEPEPVKEKK